MPLLILSLAFADLQDQTALMDRLGRNLSTYQRCLNDNMVRLGRGNTKKAKMILRAACEICEGDWLAFNASLPDAGGALSGEKRRTAAMTRKQSEEEAVLALKQARASN